jgi:hypothetical protein
MTYSSLILCGTKEDGSHWLLIKRNEQLSIDSCTEEINQEEG